MNNKLFFFYSCSTASKEFNGHILSCRIFYFFFISILNPVPVLNPSCRMFYGPGGPYALFAGKDASRALAKMSFEDKDLTGDISGLGPFELEALQDWEYKFMSKYVKVGTIKNTAPETLGESTGETTKESPAVKSEETSSSTDDAKQE